MRFVWALAVEVLNFHSPVVLRMFYVFASQLTWSLVVLEVLAPSHIVISTAPQAQQDGLSKPGAASSPCGPDTAALPYNTSTVPQSTPLHPP